MTNDQNKTEISFLPRSWGLAHRSRDKLATEEGDTARPEPDEFPNAARTVLEAPDSDGAPASLEETREFGDDLKCPCPCKTRANYGDPAELDESFLDESCHEIEAEESLDASDLCADDANQDAPDGSDISERIAVKVCGIRFGYASKIYHFESGAMELVYGDWVVVKTEKGLGLGQVALPPFEKHIHVSQLEGLRKIIRKGGKVDLYQKHRCREREAEAETYCLDRIEELSLPMKLVAVECFFDGSKYVFYFTSEGRVDFRELVKQLVSRFPVRIEMRQIGVRHEAKMTGGLAGCGQELCCSRFLTDFRPVSVKMAKNQNLSLNPTKISGVCGRLMCCLGYEHDTYEEFSRGLPKVGRMVKTRSGEGLVIKHNPLEETILIKIDEETQIEVKRGDILSEFDAASPKREDHQQGSRQPKKSGPRSSEDMVLSEEDNLLE